MKPTPITFIPSETYKALIKEAASRCIRVGCSVDDAVRKHLGGLFVQQIKVLLTDTLSHGILYSSKMKGG